MKKLTFGLIFVVAALLLSSCQFHTGLGSLFSGKPSTSATPAKHVKATHTAPAPKASSTAGNAVSITSAGFQPAQLQVKVGTVVTWTNNDTAAHTVTSDTAGVFDSNAINAGATFQFTFSQAGTFTYHSTGDSGWAGMVTVTQ
jgi:plastocyanin